MKIRTKIFGGFIIVVAIGIFLGAVGFYSNKKLTSSSEEMLHLSETRSIITSILSSHYSWRQSLSEAAYSGTTFTGSLDSATCSLGIWLKSDEIKKVTDPEEVSLLHLIIEPHDLIHARAGEIVTHLDNGEKDEAVKKFREEVLPTAREVISDLEKMNDRYDVLLREKTHEIYNLGLMFELVIIVSIVIALVVCIILSLVITSNIVKPINRIADSLKNIAEGEGNLTHTIVVNSNDEIGDLACYFNETLEKIKSLVINIRKEAGTLSKVGTDLAGNMSETAAAMNEIAATIQSIKRRIISQSASVSQTHATMEQVVTNINKLDGLVENQTSNITRASSAIEEMAANIQSVTSTLNNNIDSVHILQEASEAGHMVLQEVASNIQEIIRESEGLMEINSVMQNIASQTNLLSMNAAIEAAHAGDAGKGFAVVAGEIRKLAESSSEQSKTIGSVLKRIKGSIDKISNSTENVLAKFKAIDSNVRIVADQEEHIRAAMEEQETGSQEVVEGVIEVNEITRQVKSGSHEMFEGSSEVIKESTALEKVTQEIASGVNDMALGAEQINMAVNKVNDLCSQNRENISLLLQEVSRFKVE